MLHTHLFVVVQEIGSKTQQRTQLGVSLKNPNRSRGNFRQQFSECVCIFSKLQKRRCDKHHDVQQMLLQKNQQRPSEQQSITMTTIVVLVPQTN